MSRTSTQTTRRLLTRVRLKSVTRTLPSPGPNHLSTELRSDNLHASFIIAYPAVTGSVFVIPYIEKIVDGRFARIPSQRPSVDALCSASGERIQRDLDTIGVAYLELSGLFNGQDLDDTVLDHHGEALRTDAHAAPGQILI